MSDLRSAIKNGDATTTGGRVKGTGGLLIDDVEAAAEGDLATCPACNSIGKLFNDAYPACTLEDGRQILVEGAQVRCKCAVPPQVIASQHDFRIEVSQIDSSAPSTVLPATVSAPRWLLPESSNKLVESMEDEAYANDQTLICPNMSNATFYATMSRLRDKAVGLIGDRLWELDRWSDSDRTKVELWFGYATEETRQTLRDGLTRMREIMRGLSDKNYERYTPEGLSRVGCIPRRRESKLAASASVCKPDGTYTIFLGSIFCRSEDEANRYDGIPLARDSKLVTLIHEISHFPAAMNAEDHWYSLKNSQNRAAARDAFCISNADNIAAYVTNVPNWNGNAPVWRP